MFQHSLLDVIPEFLESCFVIPLGARAAHGHGLLSPRNRVPEATSLRPTPSHHPGPGANRSSGRALRSWPARADLKPHSSDSPSVMKFEKRSGRINQGIISVPISDYSTMVPRYRICRDVLCPLRSTTAIRTLSCGAPHTRTRADRENWVGWTGGGIAGAGLGWSFCVAVQRRSTSANALPHRTTRYKGYHQDGNHSE